MWAAPATPTSPSRSPISTPPEGFYCGQLGLSELPRPDFGVPGAWLRTGDLQLHLVETDTMPVPGPGFPHLAFYVPTDRFETTVAELAAGGVEVIAPPHRREDFGVPVWAAFVKDPAGNVVELTDVGPLA